MTGAPFVYLQESIDGAPPVLMIGNRKEPLSDGTCLLWLKIIAEFIRQRGLRAPNG